MSFALRPSEGRARLLEKAPGGDDFSDKANTIQGAIQAVREHVSVIRKETAVLTAAQGRKAGMNSAQHMKQVASVSRATIAEARRLLGILNAESGKDKGIQEMTLRKLSEGIDEASDELEKRVNEYKAAEAAWASRQPAIVENAAAEAAEDGDLETGRQRQALQEDVAQGEVDLHTAIAEEYARDVVGLANNVRGMQRILVDLAEHVEQQGEVLTSIEANMAEVQEKSAAAAGELVKTDQAQWRGMKVLVSLMATVAVASTMAVVTMWH